MSDVLSVQLHGPGPACDTIATSCVPIIFVPGVMGSRIDMTDAGRAWDPDTWTTMLKWMSFFEPGRRTTRRALSVKTPAHVLTALGFEALHAIAFNAGLASIYGLDTGTTPIVLPPNPGPDFDPAVAESGWAAQIGRYYGGQRNWSSVLWKFYGSFLMLLETQLNGDLRHPVFAFGYDWRTSCDAAGNDLAKFIGEKVAACAGARDAIVITHSMGGLVLRAALKSSPELSPKIRGVVHGAQPSNGAVVCLRRFFTGCVSALDGRDTQAFFLNSVMGNTPERFAYNLSDCQGPVQLLPNNAYQAFAGGDAPWLSVVGASLNLGEVYSEYGKTEWPGLIGPAMMAQDNVASDEDRRKGLIVIDMVAGLTAAEAFHASVANVAHPNTLVLYSTGLPTDVRLEFDAYQPPPLLPDLQSEPLSGYVSEMGSSSRAAWRSPYYGLNAASGEGPGLVVHREDAGDGTVPAVSAKCPGLTLPRPAECGGAIQHADVYKAAQYQARALAMIRMLLALPPGTQLGP